MRHHRNGSLRHVALVLTLATSIACAETGTPQEAERIRERRPAPARIESGQLRALHVAPQAPPLALTFDDGQPMVDAIAFGGSTSGVDVPAGEHSFTVAIAGEGTIMATAQDVGIAQDAGAALVVWGDLTEMNATVVPDASEPGYRFMNAIPGGNAIGIASDASESGTLRPLAAGRLTGSQSSDGSLAVDTDDDGDVDATYTLPSLDEGESGAVDVFCVGPQDPADGGIIVVASTSSGLVIVPADGPTPPARIRAIHLSPNAPDVDVFVNGDRAFLGLPFESASTYAELPGDRYDLAVAPAGAGVDAAVLTVAGVDLFAARSFSAVAFGNLPNIRALALEDDVRPTAPGKIRVRAAHTADGVGQVDILAVAPAGGVSSVVYDDVDFGTATPSIEIDAAAIRLGLDLDDDLVPEVEFDVPALPVGTVATLFAVVDAQGVALFVALDDFSTVLRVAPPAPLAPPAHIRVVHLAPQAPAVAVNANGARIVETLSFFNATEFAEVASGNTDLDIALATAPDAPVLSVSGANLAPESFTTAVAFGRLDDLRALALFEDRSPVNPGNIRIRAVHTAVGVGDVDIYIVAPTGNLLLVNDLAFGTESGYIEASAGQYTLGLDLDEDTHPDLEFALPHLAAGTVGNLFAVTDAAGNTSLAIQD